MRAWIEEQHDMTVEHVEQLWSRIACPPLLIYGKESWASNPLDDGRAKRFTNAEVVTFEKAGHWVYLDQLGVFLERVRAFLGASPKKFP